MKKIIILMLSLFLVSGLFAKDAGRKYTKATINGEAAKIFTDDKCQKDRMDMSRAFVEYNGVFYYAYPMLVQEYATEAEANYYKNRGDWSKVVFSDRVEFFYITKSGKVAKEVFDTTFYEYVVTKAIAKFIGNLGTRIGNVGAAYTGGTIVLIE